MQESTVFVLGAGCSRPYGFPLGDQLKTTMLGRFSGETKQLLEKVGFTKDHFEEFHEVLQYSSDPTVDIFLEKRRRFRKLGSYLIAATIMPLETRDSLFPQRDWYADLFMALDFERESEDPLPLSIVTLNYDRSLEYFLKKSIDYNCRDWLIERAHHKREQIRIVHAHGSLGDYPNVPYGLKPTDEAALKQAAERIKIASDKLEDSHDFHQAIDIIATAQHVVFLGFGYNQQTLSALIGEVSPDNKTYYGCALGLPEESRANVTKFFREKITLGEHDEDCTKFLKKIGISHSI